MDISTYERLGRAVQEVDHHRTRAVLREIVQEMANTDDRVRAIEAKARDYQENGELAAVDYEDRENDPPLGFAATASRNPDYLLARIRTNQRAIRDLGKRAETAERERDEARGEVGGWSQVATDAITERDALREALRQITLSYAAENARDIAAAALASATPAEGGEG